MRNSAVGVPNQFSHSLVAADGTSTKSWEQEEFFFWIYDCGGCYPCTLSIYQVKEQQG